MPKKNKAEEAKQPTEQTEKKEEKKEVARGDRGEVGQATPKLTIVQMWHEAHFTRKDVGDKHNPRKRVWVHNPGPKVSLKKFARELLKSGNAVAKEWFANKVGAKNQKRTEKNVSRISLEKQASKAARRKKSQGNQNKSKTADAATTGKK